MTEIIKRKISLKNITTVLCKPLAGLLCCQGMFTNILKAGGKGTFNATPCTWQGSFCEEMKSQFICLGKASCVLWKEGRGGKRGR